jgi:hypothetical protein
LMTGAVIRERACLTQGSRISKSHMHLTMPCAWRRRTKYLAGLSRSLRWVPHCGLECSPFLLEAVSLAYCGCEQKFNSLSEYRPGPRPHRATTRTSEPQPIRHPVGTRVGYRTYPSYQVEIRDTSGHNVVLSEALSDLCRLGLESCVKLPKPRPAGYC